LKPSTLPPNPSVSSLVSLTGAAFSVSQAPIEREISETPKINKVERSPDDEILLTELTFDCKDMITYEISSVILVAERHQSNPYGTFRCYMDSATKEFFIEISNEDTMKAFTQSALLNTLKLAEDAGAETCYMCVRKDVNRQESYLRNFLFVGFEKLREAEQKKISMTRTHHILKCSLNNEGDF